MTKAGNPAEPTEANIGIGNICVQDIETEEFRSSIGQVLPIKDEGRRAEVVARLINDVRWFRAFRLILPHQLSAEQAREHLRRGAACARDLKNWTEGVPLIIRDYVLSIIGDKPLVGDAHLPKHAWRDLGDFFGRLAQIMDSALGFVRTDRGRPDNAALNDLVWSLALIWEEFVQDPAFGLTKKRPPPYDFVKLICRAAAPDIPQADLDPEIKTAIRLAVTRLQVRRSNKSAGADD